jgi:predicted DNA-binding transcriptional regulator YafY
MLNDRLYKLKELLLARPGITMQDMITELEVAKATVKRDIEALRDRFDTPIAYDRFHGGYRIEVAKEDTSRRAVKKAELPGLWFSSDEAFALLTAQQLLTTIEPGILGPKLKPLMDKLNRLLESSGHAADAVNSRIKITPSGKRKLRIEPFQVVARATLERKRLTMSHFNRERGERMQREVSPQRLVHYRDNWYLDAWCHMRNELRSFSVDAMSNCHMLDKPAQSVPQEELDSSLGAGYGIFGGKPKAWATLKFSPARSRWVSREIWHPMQKTQTEADGSFVLQIPYSDDRELMGDILRFGADVEVVAPKELRTALQRNLLQAVGRYV